VHSISRGERTLEPSRPGTQSPHLEFLNTTIGRARATMNYSYMLTGLFMLTSTIITTAPRSFSDCGVDRRLSWVKRRLSGDDLVVERLWVAISSTVYLF
jgi:hypothetical protein